ncbi:MAG: AraC family transcriptional regulator [Lachnospiraceae bacterium]|nr:AraC family transcriptional regulator [Lachnospiraceae bacterium]
MAQPSDEITFVHNYPGLFLEEAVRHENFSMSRRHYHESVELYFLLEGERFYFVEQDTYRLSSHMAMLVGRNRIHKTSMTGANPYHKRFLLQFDPQLYSPVLESVGLPSWDKIEEKYGAVASFADEDWDVICRLIEHSKQLSSSPATQDSPLIRLHSLELLALFLKNRSSCKSMGYKNADGDLMVQTGMYQIVHEVARYLQQHCTEKVSLDELADLFYVSRSYLTRIFRSVTGFTITEYLTYLRIQKAQFLLSSTSFTITDIAELTGFGNVTYFERVFRSTTGSTPRAYRRNHNI